MQGHNANSKSKNCKMAFLFHKFHGSDPKSVFIIVIHHKTTPLADYK